MTVRASFLALIQGALFHVWRAMIGRPTFVHQADSLPMQRVAAAALLVACFTMICADDEAPSLLAAVVMSLVIAGFSIGFVKLIIKTHFPDGHNLALHLLRSNLYAAVIGYIFLMTIINLIFGVAGTNAFTFVCHFAVYIALTNALRKICVGFNELPGYAKAKGYSPTGHTDKSST